MLFEKERSPFANAAQALYVDAGKFLSVNWSIFVYTRFYVANRRWQNENIVRIGYVTCDVNNISSYLCKV